MKKRLNFRIYSGPYGTGIPVLFYLFFFPLFINCQQVETIFVHPIEMDSTLVNPGRGFATTGNTYNDNLGDRLHPPAGVIQKRWYWDFLEPAEGEIRFSMIDSILERAARNHQQLNMRVMCQNVEMRIPDWAMEQGIERLYYDDPVFLKKQENLIKALADRYDGHPDLAFVDIGTVGQWGEWHTGGSDVNMPSDESVYAIIDFYLDHFKKTPLVMLIGGAKGPGLKYALENGAGWRADCWGDMGAKWNHMKEYYPKALDSSHAYDAWKSAPVVLETCWTMQEWYDRGWDLDYILSKALEWHTTEVNNGSQSIPKAWWPRVKEFEKKLGYRFVLRELQYPSIVSSGDSMKYTMSWNNIGVAPIYQKYPLAFHFVSVEKPEISYNVVTDSDITKWMPGQTTTSSKLKIPDDMVSARYQISIGLVHPESKSPAINLAIEGKGKDGWYHMGMIRIKN